MEPESSSSLATVPSTIVGFDNEGKLVSLMLLFHHISFTFIFLTLFPRLPTLMCHSLTFISGSLCPGTDFVSRGYEA
jgi:hypothetical protein